MMSLRSFITIYWMNINLYEHYQNEARAIKLSFKVKLKLITKYFLDISS